MFTRTFHSESFLKVVYGTEAFREYCRDRQITFEQALDAPIRSEDHRRWAVALAELPHERHVQVELELATVNEMAGADEVAHLIEAAGAGQLPPDSVPQGAPVALWFYLHQPRLFHEVFVQHEVREATAWRTGRAAVGIAVADLEGSRRVLAEGLRVFFRVREGSGRFCIVEAHRLRNSYCFIAQVADRLQFLDVFTDGGKPMRQRLRRALPVLFVYYPRDGTVLLKSHLRSDGRTSELFQRFGQTVLGSPVASVDAAFDLDRLKSPFHPLPDSPDMDMIRVKALHLRYPTGRGRRQLKLETRIGDDPTAIEQLLRSHVRSEILEELRVCHAELQVRLRVGDRSRNYSIRLWPNRCSLSQTPLADRFRSCLQRWGLCHAQ